jgi:arylsulfatase A-like enzyme
MRRIGASRSLPVLLAIACGTASCAGKPARPAGIVLITLDTTRADHLGCYGDASASTPNLDAFSKEAVRFDQAMTAVPTTLPSHATMFTGEYPPVHGVRYNGMFTLGDASVTIAERLRDAGFATGAVPAAYPVYAKSGLAQGFDVYRDLFSEPGAEHLALNAERKAEDVTRLGLETIRAARQRPFFVWLHYYDAHYPYQPPFPFSSRFREHPYDGEIAYVDAQLGVLFAALRAEGLWDRIDVVVAGDHGEGLYEHGERMHSELAYQTTLRVPLLVKAAGARAGAVIAEPVTLADVAPTILDLAGLPVPAGLDGISLKKALAGAEPARRALYFETLSGSLSFGWSPIEGVRRGKWKLIRSSDPELYDLEADSAEANNLYATEGSIASDLGAVVDQTVARGDAKTTPAQATGAPLDPAALTRLASLGYVGGTVSDVRRGGPSPRSMVHLESELLLLQDVMIRGDYREALNSVANILRDDPRNRLALSSAADASAGLRDFEAAKRYGRELLARYPEFVPGVVTQGRIDVAQKDYKSAEAIFRAGLEKNPGEPVLVYSLALALIAEKRAGEARPLVDKALEAPRPDPSFRVLSALCRAMAGDDAGAKTALEQAIAAGYKDVGTLRTEPLLAPLRKIPGFEEAMTPLKAS